MVSACSLEQVHVQSGSFAGKVTDPLQKGTLMPEIGNAGIASVDEVPVEHQDLLVQPVLTGLELPVRVRHEGVPPPDPGSGLRCGRLRRSVRELEEYSMGNAVQLADVFYSLPVE